MIVPMKKAAILVQSKDSVDTIQALRSLGVVHVEHQRPPKDKAIDQLAEDIALIDGALAVLSQEEWTPFQMQGEDNRVFETGQVVKHILDLRNHFTQLKDYSLTLHDRISQWEKWGDFNPDDIRSLRDRGVYIKLYQIPVKEIKNLPSQIIVKKIYTKGGIANCVFISRQEIALPFKEVSLPKIGLAALRQRLSEDNKTIELLKKALGKAGAYRKALLRRRHMLEEELEFHQALRGMGQSPFQMQEEDNRVFETGQAAALVYLKGYIPFDAVGKLQEAAKAEKWGIVITEPAEGDRVPTLIRNPRWISIINPVFKLIEVIPGYREIDISLWFLIFFSIFFGMLIGDAGIGLIFLTLTFLAQRKWGKKLRHKSLFVLLYISAVCTVAWGALTGTFFGQEWLPQFVKPLIPALRSDKNIQALCFFLGAVHLNIAHGWRALLKLPSFAALAEVGWMLILWGAFFLARMLVLADAFPVFGKWLFITGAALVLFFTNPGKNVFKGIGAGLGSLLLNIVNSFTDVVSYIRLFAVGLATIAVADAFNAMAMEVGYNSFFAVMAMALILLTGHLLNLVLGPMSVLVHGVRLNVLEFCNHADVKWSGFAYKPFKKVDSR